MQKIFNKFPRAAAVWLAIVSAATAPLVASFVVGCKSTSTEQTAQTAVTVGQDAVDTALKVWANSWARRHVAAVAANDAATLASLKAEQTTVQSALADYQAAFRAAILGWVAAKDNLAATNSAPTAAALAGFSTAFASARTSLTSILTGLSR